MLNRVGQNAWLPLEEAAEELGLSLYNLIHLWNREKAEICVYLSMSPYTAYARLKDEEDVINYHDTFHKVEMLKRGHCDTASDIPINQYELTYIRGIFLYPPDPHSFLERDVLLEKVTPDTQLDIVSHLVSPGYIDRVRSLKGSDKEDHEFELRANGKYDLDTRIFFNFSQLVMRRSEINRLMALD